MTEPALISGGSSDERQPGFMIENLGCKVNRYESDAIAQQFEAQGYRIVEDPAEASVYVLNTCGVTVEAARKSRQLLHRAKRSNPELLVVAIGCQAELTPDALPCDLAVGNDLKHRLPEVIEAYYGGTEAPDSIEIGAVKDFAEYGPVTRQEETRAYLKVQDGCNSFCSYCTIPLARGRVRSRAEDEILKEAELLARAGFREVVLTGIHVCSYGLDRGEDSMALARLITKIDKIAGLKRIRLSSLEPQSISRAFVQKAAEAAKLCPHFHLSLQSGSDKILKAMRRRYDTARFRQSAEAIREVWPEAGLTTDVIVGFPGETEEDFADTLDFCREIGFSRLHVFRYSERPGTLAVNFPDKVDGNIAKARSEKLIALGDELAREAMRRRLGTETEILLEALTPEGNRRGYSPEYLLCELEIPVQDRDKYAEGDIVRVRLKALSGERILAENAGFV